MGNDDDDDDNGDDDDGLPVFHVSLFVVLCPIPFLFFVFFHGTIPLLDFFLL